MFIVIAGASSWFEAASPRWLLVVLFVILVVVAAVVVVIVRGVVILFLILFVDLHALCFDVFAAAHVLLVARKGLCVDDRVFSQRVDFDGRHLCELVNVLGFPRCQRQQRVPQLVVVRSDAEPLAHC